jgi:hypothetical protein
VSVLRALAHGRDVDAVHRVVEDAADLAREEVVVVVDSPGDERGDVPGELLVQLRLAGGPVEAGRRGGRVELGVDGRVVQVREVDVVGRPDRPPV